MAPLPVIADPAPVDDAPAGPSPEEEAAFLAEERMTTPVMSTPPTAAAEHEDVSGPLPSLDELVNRIPGPTRELLEELFRSRFLSVKRMPRSALKD